MALFLGTNIPYVGIYIVWTMWMGYNFPMPYGNIFCGYIGIFIKYVAVWFRFPLQLRKHPEFRKKLKFYLLYGGVLITTGMQNIILDKVFVMLTSYQNSHRKNVQWIMAFFIPISRRFYEVVIPKLGS